MTRFVVPQWPDTGQSAFEPLHRLHHVSLQSILASQKVKLCMVFMILVQRKGTTSP